MQMKSAV